MKYILWERTFKKLFIISIWIIIVLGVYQCSANLSNNDKFVADTTEEFKKDKKEDKADRNDMIQQKLLEENTIKTILDEKVRVLIMNQGYQGIYHAELSIVCNEGIIVDRMVNY